MKVERSKTYIKSLQNIKEYISKDSVSRALNFEYSLDKNISLLTMSPFMYRKSLFSFWHLKSFR